MKRWFVGCYTDENINNVVAVVVIAGNQNYVFLLMPPDKILGLLIVIFHICND